MAKKGTEEESFTTLDNAFQGVEEELADETGKTVETEVKETEQPETEPETTETEVTKPEVTETETETETKAEADAKTAEKTWADLGHERFDGMSRGQIAREIDWRNRQYGEQANELGRLRKEVEELKTPEKKPEASEVPVRRGMTQDEVTEFNEMYERDPVGAMLKFGADDFKQMVSESVKEAMGGDFQEMVGSRVAGASEAIAYENFLTSHNDAEEYVPLMQQLDGAEYLGEQGRNYNELYELARLGKSQDLLYPTTYRYMKLHPTFSFAEAKRFAELEQRNPKASGKKREAIKKTVAKLDTVNTTSTKKSASANSDIPKSVDAAFDGVDDEI